MIEQKPTKLRVWDKEKQKMIDVDSIYLKGEITWINPEEGIWKQLKDVDVLWSTGKKDEDDKKIFAGDIVQTKTFGNTLKHKGIVYWSQKYAGYAIKLFFKPINDIDAFLKKREGMYNSFEMVQFVLGNIYENPELLTDMKLYNCRYCETKSFISLEKEA